MKKRTVIFFLIVISAFLLSNYILINKEYTVAEIVDGDTFKTADGKSVRLIGVNSPEIGRPCSQEAKNELRKLIYGKEVKMESDSGDKDMYGRLLRYVYVDDIFVNSEMIRLGLAKTEEINPNVKYSQLFQSLEWDARKAHRCMWNV
jgi:micrococcal nuclease